MSISKRSIKPLFRKIKRILKDESKREIESYGEEN